MFTKSRRRLTKSSRVTGRLGDRPVEDDGDTCRESGGGVADTLLLWGLVVSSSKPSEDGLVVWASKPSEDGLLVWASKPGVDGLVG